MLPENNSVEHIVAASWETSLTRSDKQFWSHSGSIIFHRVTGLLIFYIVSYRSIHVFAIPQQTSVGFYWHFIRSFSVIGTFQHNYFYRVISLSISIQFDIHTFLSAQFFCNRQLEFNDTYRELDKQEQVCIMSTYYSWMIFHMLAIYFSATTGLHLETPTFIPFMITETWCGFKYSILNF